MNSGAFVSDSHAPLGVPFSLRLFIHFFFFFAEEETQPMGCYGDIAANLQVLALWPKYLLLQGE